MVFLFDEAANSDFEGVIKTSVIPVAVTDKKEESTATEVTDLFITPSKSLLAALSNKKTIYDDDDDYDLIWGDYNSDKNMALNVFNSSNKKAPSDDSLDKNSDLGHLISSDDSDDNLNCMRNIDIEIDKDNLYDIIPSYTRKLQTDVLIDKKVGSKIPGYVPKDPLRSRNRRRTSEKIAIIAKNYENEEMDEKN